jgi:uncharacterized membrane protein YraQ (UPF0718 family)
LIEEFYKFITSTSKSAVTMLNSASTWILMSFVIAGILHEYLSPDKMRKRSIGTAKISGVFWTTVTGMFIPICSCGTIPLGISMYYSGAYLGPTLAFMTSTPMINPISVILAWGLLGKEITIIYVITGFVAPMIIGIVANRFGGDELHVKGLEEEIKRRTLVYDEPSCIEKLKTGLKWSFTELAVTVSKYTVSGLLIAGLVFNIFPQSAIQTYLGSPGFVSLFGITVVAALMYVCAVGHIPFIAALVASGAAPGVAITFLMAGAATNISELLTISKTIGKRAMFMYFAMVTVISNIVGYITNSLLMPGFKPVLNYDATSHTISKANILILVAPEWLKYTCTIILFGYALYGLYQKIIGKKTILIGR